MILLHSFLFWASLFRSCHSYPSFSISWVVFLLQVFLGLPTLLFPCGFHCRARRVIEFVGFLNVCPIHPHFIFLMSCSTGNCLVFPYRSVFLILSGHLMFMIRLRQLLTKTCSLLRRLFVVFHVSQPYKSMVFISVSYTHLTLPTICSV